jgi:UDP-N-acetylglucosamine 2-epimerase
VALNGSRFHLLQPFLYNSFSRLYKDAKLVMIDSVEIPRFTIRENTERPVTINILLGRSYEPLQNFEP